MLSTTAIAQVDSTAADTTVRDSVLNVADQDTLNPADSANTRVRKPAFKIFPWKYHASLDARQVSTDSTLRWQVWTNWVDKKNRDPGVISYRMGTIARTNAFLIQSHEPRHQQLLWEGVTMNDPVSGTVNWDIIPLHKIRNFYEENDGIQHISSYFLKQHYLSEPLSQLVYKESKFNTRSLEFIVSRNFGPQTNAEISYWDRRDGGEYSNSEVGGRQIFARVFHQLDHRQALKVHFLNHNFNIGEPFGYGITDLSLFAFNRYMANPRQVSAESELGSSNVSINYYRRDGDTTNVSADDFQAGLFFNSRKRALTYNVDSTYYKVQSIGLNVYKWLDWDPLHIEAGITNELFLNKNRDESDLQHGNWNILRGSASANFRPFSLLEINGGALIQNRSDGFSSQSINLSTTLHLGRRLRISAGAARGTIMPTPQQLYWSSLEYQGNPDLVNESVDKIHGSITLDLFNRLTVGARGQLKDIDNGIMIEDDSTFANLAPYGSASASAFFEYNGRRFELSGSGTAHQFGNFMEASEAPLPVDDNMPVWLKGGAYVKGYLFNRAAYVKAGLSGMISPFSYRASHYNPVLDYWQAASDDQYLPSFDRLDVDISARIRTIMVTLRWENILDEVSQLGYFETAQYPMGQRRFIFGIRALFRN